MATFPGAVPAMYWSAPVALACCGAVPNAICRTIQASAT